jgi:pantothenate kinase
MRILIFEGFHFLLKEDTIMILATFLTSRRGDVDTNWLQNRCVLYHLQESQAKRADGWESIQNNKHTIIKVKHTPEQALAHPQRTT